MEVSTELFKSKTPQISGHPGDSIFEVKRMKEKISAIVKENLELRRLLNDERLSKSNLMILESELTFRTADDLLAASLILF